MIKRVVISFSLISLLTFSCQFEKRQSGFEDFDKLWKTVDMYYPFLEFKNIDWKAIKSKYRPKFEEITRKERVILLGKMINELQDGHANLFDNEGNYLSFYEMPRFQKDDNLFDYKVVKSYFKHGLSNVNIMYDYGRTSENIGYIYIHRFPGDKNIFNEIDSIIDTLKNTKGLIIDLRHSGGGNSSASDYIVEKLISDTLIGVIWTKENGENFPAYKYVPSKSEKYQRPVIVLINGKSYSVPENLANLCKKIDNIIVVGDTTGGGGGIPRIFKLPSGSKFRIPTRAMLRYDDQQVEWNGIPPDILIQNSTEDLNKGKDNQLEYALSRLK